MELWIRSQDKEKLLKVNGIQYQNCKLVENEIIEGNILIGFHNSYDNEILGEYKTKERALEVLDEIQSILIGKYVTSLNFSAAFSNIKKENGKELLNQMAVYDMPKE